MSDAIARLVLRKLSGFDCGNNLARRGIPLGASIAVNGACLTVVQKGKRAR